MFIFSIETLYHFNCSQCGQWWSIGDYKLNGSVMTCPHCRHQSTQFQQAEKLPTTKEEQHG